MRRQLRRPGIVGLVVLLAAAGSNQQCAAQTRSGSESREPARWEDIDFESIYDADRVITARGPITAFWHFPLGERRTGVIARLHVQGEAAHVYLGTLEFLDQNDLKLSINDYVSVQGNRAILRYRGILVVADTIAKGEQSVRLRDDGGRPRWR